MHYNPFWNEHFFMNCEANPRRPLVTVLYIFNEGAVSYIFYEGANPFLEQELYETVSVLGREEGYMVKYTALPEGVPEGEAEGTPEGKGVYLTVYPELSPNADSI